MNGKELIVVTGLPASGKSTLANQIAIHKGLSRISSDDIRSFYLYNSNFEPNIKYSKYISAMVFDVIYLKAELELTYKNGVVLDGIFFFPPGWERLKEIADRTGSEVFFYQFIGSFETLSTRMKNRNNDPYNSEADIEVLKKHWDILEKNDFQYPTRNPDFLKLNFHWEEIEVKN
ncbi:MAG: AAA family ATPase [Leptospiraceae bacterium]|nr:AAA family ATPase [Leptospiraceae bacterium]MCP5494069.1 AAA family ATPase [Leptospiraceae bacterium]